MGSTRSEKSTFSPNSISLIRDSALLMAAEFFAIILGLLSQIILTRGLDNSEFGLWIIVYDVGLTIFILTDPGFSVLLSREVPRNKEDSLPFLKSIFKIQIFFAFFAFISIIVGLALFGYKIVIFKNFTIILMIIGTFSLSVAFPFKTYLRSIGKASWEASFRLSERLSITLGFLFVYNNGGNAQDFAYVIAIMPSFVTICMILVCFRLAHSLSTKQDFQSLSRKLSIETSPIQILRRATPFFIFIAALQILDRADKFFLAFHVPLDHIATYGISLLVFFSGMTLIRIIRNVTMPWLSESGNDHSLMVERYRISSYLCFSILPFGVVMALLLMMTVPIVIFPEDLIYPGHQEFSSESIFRILLITWSINMVLSPAWEAMRAFQPANVINKISITGLVITIISGIILIPLMGVYGAAAMTLIAPLIFLFLAHYKMENTLLNSLDHSYFRDLIVMTIYSFTPLIIFIPSLDSISAFLLILVISMMLGIKILSTKPEKSTT